MKLKTPELAVIAVTVGILLFTLGYFTGRAAMMPDGGVAVITQRQPSPSVPEETPDEPEEAPEEPSEPAEPEKIDINQADAAKLTELPGIGPKTAEAIVSYREAMGPFDKIEDLMEVDGIGEGKLDDIRELICAGGSEG